MKTHQGWPLSTSFPVTPAPSLRQHDERGKINWRQQNAPKIQEEKAHWSIEDCDVENTHMTAGYSCAVSLRCLKNGPANKGEMTGTVTAAQSYGKQVLLIWLLKRCAELCPAAVPVRGKNKKWCLREETWMTIILSWKISHKELKT